MDKSQRVKVTQDQVQRFFASYYSNWRLHQILTLEKLYKERFDFYKDIIQTTKQSDDPDGSATIAQEVGNGLLFEAISHCIQYIEDLFAIVKAGENVDFFIKGIITYDAGKISNFIKQKFNREQLCKAFHFPFYSEDFPDKGTNEVYKSAIERLFNLISVFKQFHKQYQFFYTQYKHGLTIALRPYGLYDNEKIEKSKTGEFDPYLAAFDNLGAEKLKDKQERFNNMLFMPCFTESVRENLPELMREDNLIRYVFPPEDTDFEKMKEIAFRVRDCINVIGNNIMEKAANPANTDRLKVQLPDNDINKVVVFTFFNVES